MNLEKKTIVDFIVRGNADDDWSMVLVEEGPWKGQIDAQLSRLQERLYGCLDAALDGQLAEKYPESKGKRIAIKLDCYNVPKEEVADFFERFSKGVLATADYLSALKGNKYVRGVSFEVSFDHIH